MIETALDSTLLWILVMMRMSGMVFFNSIFGRNNIPIIMRLGLVLVLTYATVSFIPLPAVIINTWIGFGFLLVKELLVGFFMGYIISAILGVPMVAGEVLDMQVGISMAKMYDPQSNVSMPITGSIFNSMLIMIFFMANGHLSLISMMIQSFGIIPVGSVALQEDMLLYCIRFFGTALGLALKLALPFVAIQLMTEVAVGILMKAIPQINVFVLNIQLKLLMGFMMILVLVPEIAEFLDGIVNTMLDAVENGILTFF